jgi:hypothetical protein
MARRSPDEIRASIEANRQELGMSLERLRDEVTELTDWRSQLRRNQQQLVIGAAGMGFLLGGGLTGVGGVLFGGKRRKRARAAKRSSRA